MIRTLRIVGVVKVFLVLISCTSAFSQQQASESKSEQISNSQKMAETLADGSASEGQMVIESISMEADLEGNLVVFSGQVKARDKDYLLNADKLTVHLGGEDRSPEKIIATGKVRIEQKNMVSESDKATIFPGEDRVLLEGNARVRQGANIFSGKSIEYVRSTGRVLIREGVRVSIADLRSLSLPAQSPQPRTSPTSAPQ